MIYSYQEYINLRHSKRPNITDQYEVTFKVSGLVQIKYYITEGKNEHDKVVARWREDWPDAEFIKVSYS